MNGYVPMIRENGEDAAAEERLSLAYTAAVVVLGAALALIGWFR